MSGPDRLVEIKRRRAALRTLPWEPDDIEIFDADGMEHTVRQILLTPAGQQGLGSHSFTDADFILHAPEDIDWLIGECEAVCGLARTLGAEVERLRERLRGYEGYRAYSTCRICGEPIERFRNIWYHETTRDHDAEPTAEIRST